MADFPFAILENPVSEADPCGPDLWMEGDGDYLMFTDRLQGILPKSYFDFDRGQVDVEAESAKCAALCKRTVDLRVLVPFAKLLILNRDLSGFQKCVSAIAGILSGRWDTAHPRPEGGDSSYRAGELQALGDVPHTVYGVQSAPLFKTRRFGAVTLRHYLLVERIIQPRKVLVDTDDDGQAGVEEEKVPSAADLRGAIGDVDLAELVAVRDVAGALVEALAAIEATFDEKSGKIGILRMKELGEVSMTLYRFLDECVAGRDPTQAKLARVVAGRDEQPDGDGDAPASAAPAGPASVSSQAEALAAIRAAFVYFSRREASSTARLWLAQALSLAGKSFYDALRALVPDYAGQASVTLARDLPLTLPIERLSELLAEEALQIEDAPSEDGAAEEPQSEEPQPEEPSGEDEAQEGESSGEDEAVHSAPAAASPPPMAGPRTYVAEDRLMAIRLIEAAAAHIRTIEPSSPIPMLLDQAKAGAGRDFVSLLREVLPSSALRID